MKPWTCVGWGPSFVFIRTPPCQNVIYRGGETFLLYKNILIQDKIYRISKLAQLLFSLGSLNILKLKPIRSDSIFSLPWKSWGEFWFDFSVRWRLIDVLGKWEIVVTFYFYGKLNSYKSQHFSMFSPHDLFEYWLTL